ncbi:MAG TPA: deoxyribose-phosphate aldolase [Anaeromyxobacteraceae bacterium]
MIPVASPRDLAPLIDHTVLRPDASADDVARACDEALAHGFAGVCVRETHLRLVVRRLGGRDPLAIAVADFPRGDGPARARAEEVRRLAGEGAREVDVVFPLPALAARDHAAALRDLEAVVRAAGSASLKVILETAALDTAEKGAACALAKAAGAAFVKTSTGFGPGGATEADVALLRALVGAGTGVKASGGIRTAADALRMVRAGASRLGASASVAIVTGTF